MQFDEKFEDWAKKVKKYEQEKRTRLIEQERENFKGERKSQTERIDEINTQLK